MAEEEHRILSEDEIKDQTNIKAYIEQIKNPEELAGKLTEYFSKKYGPDFRGEVKFEYNMTENKMKMTCNDQIREFEMGELLEIPSHIQFLRKTAQK